jgi:hypothetical protein
MHSHRTHNQPDPADGAHCRHSRHEPEHFGHFDHTPVGAVAARWDTFLPPQRSATPRPLTFTGRMSKSRPPYRELPLDPARREARDQLREIFQRLRGTEIPPVLVDIDWSRPNIIRDWDRPQDAGRPVIASFDYEHAEKRVMASWLAEFTPKPDPPASSGVPYRFATDPFLTETVRTISMGARVDDPVCSLCGFRSCGRVHDERTYETEDLGGQAAADLWSAVQRILDATPREVFVDLYGGTEGRSDDPRNDAETPTPNDLTGSEE